MAHDSQEKNQSLEDFLGVFKSTCKTIDATGGCAGYHPALYQKHLDVLWNAADLDEEKAEQPSAGKQIKDCAPVAMLSVKKSTRPVCFCLLPIRIAMGRSLPTCTISISPPEERRWHTLLHYRGH